MQDGDRNALFGLDEEPGAKHEDGRVCAARTDRERTHVLALIKNFLYQSRGRRQLELEIIAIDTTSDEVLEKLVREIIRTAIGALMPEPPPEQSQAEAQKCETDIIFMEI